MANYYEPTAREKNEVAPKITDANAVTASQEQLLRGILEANQSGGSGGGTQNVDIVSQSKSPLTASLRLPDSGGTLGNIQRNGKNMKVDLAQRSQARTAAGEQSFDPNSGNSQPIEPSSSGSVAGSFCDILIRNTGTETLWITGNGTTDSGFELKSDEDTGRLFYEHTSTDGDLQVRTDSNASSSGSAEAFFRG